MGKNHHFGDPVPELGDKAPAELGALVAVCKDHPARDGYCEKIRAEIPADARRVTRLWPRPRCGWGAGGTGREMGLRPPAQGCRACEQPWVIVEK